MSDDELKLMVQEANKNSKYVSLYYAVLAL